MFVFESRPVYLGWLMKGATAVAEMSDYVRRENFHDLFPPSDRITPIIKKRRGKDTRKEGNNDNDDSDDDPDEEDSKYL